MAHIEGQLVFSNTGEESKRITSDNQLVGFFYQDKIEFLTQQSPLLRVSVSALEEINKERKDMAVRRFQTGRTIFSEFKHTMDPYSREIVYDGYNIGTLLLHHDNFIVEFRTNGHSLLNVSFDVVEDILREKSHMIARKQQ